MAYGLVFAGAVSQSNLTLNLTVGAVRSPPPSSLWPGNLCARAHRVPRLGKPENFIETKPFGLSLLRRVRQRGFLPLSRRITGGILMQALFIAIV